MGRRRLTAMAMGMGMLRRLLQLRKCRHRRRRAAGADGVVGDDGLDAAGAGDFRKSLRPLGLVVE